MLFRSGKAPGVESFKQFLRDYAGMANMLFKSFSMTKLSLEISDGNWACCEDEMLSFLDVNRIPSPNAFPQNGVYTNEALDFAIKVDGLSLIDPTGQKRRLFPKSQNEFYVDWLPTVLWFEDEKIIISGSQICERWTTTGMVYEIIK